jgi:hypothetical protein
MKRKLNSGLVILLLSICCAIGCKKSITDPVTEPATPSVKLPDSTAASTAINTTVHPYPVTNPNQECVYAPNYGDSVVYPQPTTSNFYLYPKNPTNVQGTYFSWPGGLVLDSKTGAINLTLSETGSRYDIAFVQYGTTDTCISHLIVAGTAYLDSVYVLTRSSNSSAPYYNANPYAPSPCQYNHQGSGCVFDLYNVAKNKGIQVNNQTGAIDLQSTVKNAFGRYPVNGTVVNTTIYYVLNDNSNYAVQKIPLQLAYYNRRSDIPSALLSSITNKRNSALNNQLLSKGPSPRPPLIIIVRNF